MPREPDLEELVRDERWASGGDCDRFGWNWCLMLVMGRWKVYEVRGHGRAILKPLAEGDTAAEAAAAALATKGSLL